MSTNDWKARLGMVYSTNPDFEYNNSDEGEVEVVAPSKQDLRVWLDRKQRGGKVATLVCGFRGSESELKDLARTLKSKCGVGGAAKDGEIIIQGDHRDKVVDLLIKAGYKCKKAGG